MATIFPIPPTYAPPFIRRPNTTSDTDVVINPIWLDWFLSVSQTIAPQSFDHQNLTGLQGGAAGEYYHLTAAQHAAAIALLASPGRFALPIHADAMADAILTNQAVGVDWFAFSDRNIVRVDLSRSSEIRLRGRVTVASASGNAPRVFCGYSTTYSTTAGDYTELASIPLTSAGYAASAWAALGAAQADVYLGFFQQGGDGTEDPAVAQLGVEFR